MHQSRRTGTRVDVGIGVRALPGETECGDACESIPWSRGLIVAIADGLGHGVAAGTASKAFVACVRECAELTLEETFFRAHRVLIKTRGAVGAVARFDPAQAQVEVAALGNISALLVCEERVEHLVLAPGVLGSAYHPVRPVVRAFGVNDILMLHTDGIHARLDMGLLRGLSAHVAADTVLRTYAKATDDACCAFVRGVIDQSEPRLEVAPAAEGSSSASGAEPRAIPVLAPGDAERAAREARSFARAAGLSPRAQWEVSLAVSHLVGAIVNVAGAWEIRLRIEHTPRRAVVVEATHGGSTGGDVDRAALQPVSRLVDRVEVESDAERGKRIVAWKFDG